MGNKTRILVIIMLFLLALLVGAYADDRDSDLDGVPDLVDKYPFDYDNDGMPDVWEKKYGLRYDMSDANEDPDDDGIKNVDEYKQSTDPLVSEKTQERVELELLTPVERTMARGLIWGGSLFLLLLLVGFILYRVHILRIFKFLHHVSKEHFEHNKEKEYLEKRKFTGHYMGPYRRGPFLPGQHRVRPYPRMVLRQRPIRKEVPRYAIREFKPQEVKKEGSFERLNSYTEERKPRDVFGRLSEHIHEHKKIMNIRK